jgi:hypothetical protein
MTVSGLSANVDPALAHVLLPTPQGDLTMDPNQPIRLNGIRRGLATFGLALGLLAVGGAAVVLAASPDPSSSATPSTQPSTTGGSTTTGRAPCPDGSGGQAPAASPSTGTSSSSG